MKELPRIQKFENGTVDVRWFKASDCQSGFSFERTKSGTAAYWLTINGTWMWMERKRWTEMFTTWLSLQ